MPAGWGSDRRMRDQYDESSLATYARDWRVFTRWCGQRAVASLPATDRTVAEFALSEADRGLRLSTIEQRLFVIGVYHKTHDFPNPARSSEVELAMQQVCERRDLPKRRRVKALTYDVLLNVLDANEREVPPETAARDAALLTLGFYGELRRHQLSRLRIEDVDMKKRWLHIAVVPTRKSDGNPCERQRIHTYAANPSCPVSAMRRWLDVLDESGGPLFRRMRRGGNIQPVGISGHAIAEIVKGAVARVGLDPADYSGHSLRIGYAESQLVAVESMAEYTRQMQALQRQERDTETRRAAKRVGGDAHKAYSLIRQAMDTVDRLSRSTDDPMARALWRAAYDGLLRDVEANVGEAVRLV